MIHEPQVKPITMTTEREQWLRERATPGGPAAPVWDEVHALRAKLA